LRRMFFIVPSTKCFDPVPFLNKGSRSIVVQYQQKPSTAFERKNYSKALNELLLRVGWFIVWVVIQMELKDIKK
ncbi:MAG: hypothetical protein EZS28_043793, partial [Streblomastix strix]